MCGVVCYASVGFVVLLYLDVVELLRDSNFTEKSKSDVRSYMQCYIEHVVCLARPLRI